MPSRYFFIIQFNNNALYEISCAQMILCCKFLRFLCYCRDKQELTSFEWCLYYFWRASPVKCTDTKVWFIWCLWSDRWVLIWVYFGSAGFLLLEVHWLALNYFHFLDTFITFWNRSLPFVMWWYNTGYQIFVSFKSERFLLRLMMVWWHFIQK